MIDMKSFNQLIKERKNTVSYKTEQAKLDFILNISRAMKDKNMSKADLAEKMGTSKAYITKILQGDGVNFTIDTMVKICWALGGILENRIYFPDTNKSISKANRYSHQDNCWKEITEKNDLCFSENSESRKTKNVFFILINQNNNRYSNIVTE